jgi:hypothetical protein
MENSFWNKIKDEYISIVIGIIVSLPAIGIVIPQIFSVMGEQQVMDLPTSFKLFSMAYFTMPLVILFILSFFQFTNDVLLNLRKQILGIIIPIAVVSVLLIFPKSKIENFPLINALPWLLIGLWGCYWWLFHKTINKLIKDVTTYKDEIKNKNSPPASESIKQQLPDSPTETQTPVDIAAGSAVSNSSLEPTTTNWGNDVAAPPVTIQPDNTPVNPLPANGAPEEKLKESYVAIKLGVFYLFIAAQLVVVIMLTLFNKVYNNHFWIWIMIASYAAVLIYYLLHPGLKTLRLNKEISSSFLPSILGIVVIIISIIFYTSKNKDASFNFTTINAKYLENFSGIELVNKNREKIDNLDSVYADVGRQLNDQKISMIPLNYLNAIIKDGHPSKDSLYLLNEKIISYYKFGTDKKDTIVDKVKPINTFLKHHANNARTAVLSGKLDSLYSLLQNDYNPKTAKTREKKVKDLLDNIETNSLYKALNDSNSKNTYKYQSIQNTLQSKRKSLVIQSRLLSDKIKRQQINLIKDLQHAGIIIFLTTLIVVASFLLILSYNDDNFHPETLPEVNPIKKILQIVCLVIAILLIPLVKIVPEEQVDPEKPSSIFLVSNWNLARSLPEPEEKSGNTDTKKTSRPGLTPVQPAGDCCCHESGDTLKIKFIDSTSVAVGNLIKTIDANSKLLNIYFATVNQVLLRPNPQQPIIDTTRFLRRMDTTNKLLRNFSTDLNSIAAKTDRNLQDIKNAINSSQIKSKLPN